MPYQIMMVFAVLVGLFLLRKVKNKWTIIITVILSVAVLLTCIANFYTYLLGRYLFAGGMGFIILYTLIKPNNTFKKITIVTVTAGVLAYHIFQLNQFPHTSLFGYLLAIPIAVFIFIVINNYKLFYHEITYLSIVAMAAVVGFIFQILPIIQ